MRKLITILFSTCIILAVCAIPALAAEVEPVSEQSNVTITVVMPTPATEPEVAELTTPTVIKVFPSDVTELRDGGNWQIIKTYELSAGELAEDIPRDSFERQGWTFTLTDIIRKESANAETRAHTETITLDTETNDLAAILTLLSPTMEYTADDGFVGILSLDVSSIKVETAGTRTSSYNMSVTREYPHLSTNDTSLVPKTVTDRGTTYTLAGVDWKAGNYVTVDYERIPEYYTAIATYNATGYSTKVTGYTTSAVYTGSLAKLSQGKTYYTAYFLGEEIRTPLEMVSNEPPLDVLLDGETEVDTSAEPTAETEPTIEPTAAPDENGGDSKPMNPLFVILPAAAALAGGAFYFIKKKKKGATTI